MTPTNRTSCRKLPTSTEIRSEEPMKHKTVRFARTKQVRRILSAKSMSTKQKSRIWFSRDELHHIDECNDGSVWQLEHGTFVEDDQDTATGLYALTAIGQYERFRRTQEAIEVVLQQQQVQGLNGDSDGASQKVAEKYKKCTSESRYLARMDAHQAAREASMHLGRRTSRKSRTNALIASAA